MQKRTLFLITLFILTALLSAGCSLGKRVSSEDETATPPEAPVEEVVTLPTPTPVMPPTSTPETTSLVGEPAGNGESVSLLGGAAPAPTLPAPGAEAAQVIRQARYNTPRFSFEAAAGWQIDELDGKDTLLIHITDDEGAYSGQTNLSPYAYLQYTNEISGNIPLVDVLDEMRSSLAGVESSEKAAMPIIDGLRGAGQFVEGSNDVTTYRAYLVVFPLQGGVLKAVFWGDNLHWGDVAPPLNSILSTLRWTAL